MKSQHRLKADLSKLQAQCDRFNEVNAVGCKVSIQLDSGEQRETTTRSEAQVLSGHSAVIWLDGVRGCYQLDRVKAIPATAGAAA